MYVPYIQIFQTRKNWSCGNNPEKKKIGTRIISTFLRMVLTLNNFVFNCQTTYRLKAAPWAQNAHAIMFTGMFEERYIYPLIKTMSKLYLRFIDDIFLIWTGTNQIKTKINKIQSSIKFDFNVSNREINFLDAFIKHVVYKTQSGKLETRLYRKESHRQAYLHHKSEHPEW